MAPACDRMGLRPEIILLADGSSLSATGLFHAVTGGRIGRPSRRRFTGGLTGDHHVMPPDSPTSGPRALWLVRHAESEGNVADQKAQEAGAGDIGIDVRDPDVELSGLGR